MAQIILNGNKKEIPDNTTISMLLSDMELPKYFVVEKNLNIIYKENFDKEILVNGDAVEIAVFCGGG